VLLAGTTSAFAADSTPWPGATSSTTTPDGSTPNKKCHGEAGSTGTSATTAPSAPATSSGGAANT